MVIYTRTSSKKNAVKLMAHMLNKKIYSFKQSCTPTPSSLSWNPQASQRRQSRACQEAAKRLGKRPAATVTEVKSGMLPLLQRPQLQKLLDHPKGLTILVESARAIARDAQVSEEAWRKSKAGGISIVAADLPELFKHHPSPGEALIRKVMFAVFEFERDLVVARLSDGLAQKRSRTERGPKTIGQSGRVKVNGRLSRLQKAQPSKPQCRRMLQAMEKYKSNERSLLETAEAFRQILSAGRRGKLTPITKETCRRMMTELSNRQGWKF